jgi:hypothetical protein
MEAKDSTEINIMDNGSESMHGINFVTMISRIPYANHIISSTNIIEYENGEII